MADILLDAQTPPTTPSANQGVAWVDTSTERGVLLTPSDGHHYGLLSRNYMTAASQAPAANTDTYISNSGLLIPSWGLQAGCTAR